MHSALGKVRLFRASAASELSDIVQKNPSVTPQFLPLASVWETTGLWHSVLWSG